MRAFDYVAAGSVDEAIGLLGEHGTEAKVLAGGQSLLPLLNYRLARPRVVVDINDLPLATIRAGEGARVTLQGPAGSRTLDVADFFGGYLTTALAADELLTGIEVPATNGAGWAVEEFSRRPGDFAIVAVAALVTIDAHGHVADTRLALGGIAPSPRRVSHAEDALGGHEPTSERIQRVAESLRDAIEPPSDAFVSAAYRRHLAGVLAKRALTRAVARAMEVR